MGATLEIGNRGVAALAASLVKLIFEQQPDAHIFFLLGRKNSAPFGLGVNGEMRELPVLNYRISPKAPLDQQLWWIVLLAAFHRIMPVEALRRKIAASNPWIRAVLEADWVGDIRGGDSFSDIYGLRRLLEASAPALAVRWLKGRLVLLPQTYGPFKTWVARRTARHIIEGASMVLSRDKESLQVIQQLTQGKCRGQFCPDVAFALNPVMPRELCITPALPDRRAAPLIGLNVNGLMYNGGYTRTNMFGLKLDYPEFLRCLVEALTSIPQYRILLVPHTFAPMESVESDPTACEKLRRQLPDVLLDRIHLVTQDYDQNEIKGVIGLCDFFIGSRMHSCIAALSQGIPTIGVAYSKKFHGVFDSIGVGDWIIDGRMLDVEDAVRRTTGFFESRDRMRLELMGKVDAAKQQLRDTFAALTSSHTGQRQGSATK